MIKDDNPEMKEEHLQFHLEMSRKLKHLKTREIMEDNPEIMV